MDINEAIDAARAAGSNRMDSVIHGMADRLGVFASASAVFGEPVERDGVTVIPVAKVRWGFGGGEGRDEGDDEEGPSAGSGGGGGVMASPLGFIEVRDGHADFRLVRDPASYAPLVLASGFTAWLVLRALRSLFR